MLDMHDVCITSGATMGLNHGQSSYTTKRGTYKSIRYLQINGNAQQIYNLYKHVQVDGVCVCTPTREEEKSKGYIQ